MTEKNSLAHRTLRQIADLAESVDEGDLGLSTLRLLAEVTVALSHDVSEDVLRRIGRATPDECEALADLALSAKSTAKLAVALADPLSPATYDRAMSVAARAERASQKAREAAARVKRLAARAEASQE
jgi:hypothetical protein